jgi:hypothetical protein
MEDVSARPPGAIGHATAPATSLAISIESSLARAEGGALEAVTEASEARPHTRVRSSEAGRLSVKRLAPRRIHAG